MTSVDNSASWTFAYNADGLRTRRTNGTTTYNYTYLGGQLTHMTADGHTLYFTYDASGTPLTLTYDGLKFYYITNLQGDVISIIDGNGTEFARYTYDAWGKLINIDGTATNLRRYNPLRYRGYVYDTETELYYLQNRYYNPEMERFVNADQYPSTGQGLTGNNMFAYCGNNPVSRKDDGGEFWHIVIGAAVGALVSFTSSVISDVVSGEKIDLVGAGISAAFGAASGTLAATGLGAVAQVAGGAALAGAENAIDQGREKGFDKIDYGEVAVNSIIGGITSRNNGVSKGVSKHLHKQAAVGMKRLKLTSKYSGFTAWKKALKPTAKYYFSQTNTLFYKPLINVSISTLISDIGYIKDMCKNLYITAI